jgi:putative component of toxin-antitoxin plasmid stabilization module
VNTLIRTAEFDAWLKRLRDAKAVARIIERLRSA